MFSIALFAGLALAQTFTDLALPPAVLNASDSCWSALNTTVSCPSALVQVSLDYSLLDNSTLASLCVDSCSSSLQSVRQSIQQGCTASTDTVDHDGDTYPATYVADKLLFAYSLACRRDATSNDFCDTVFNTWRSDFSKAPNSTAIGCQDCILGTQEILLNSPFGYNDQAASQFASATSSCGASGYAYTSPAAYALATASVPDLSNDTTACSSTYTIQAGDSCSSVSQSKKVSTEELRRANNLTPPCNGWPDVGQLLCIPATCNSYVIQSGDSCADIATKAGISAVQFLTWNPHVNAMCGNLYMMVGESLCLSQPGGGGAAATASITTMVSAAPSSAAPAPTNADSKSNTDCGRWYTAQDGDYCKRISLTQGISMNDFIFLNPDIDANCTNLLLGTAYCVQAVGDIHTYSGYPQTTNFITLTSASYTTATQEIQAPWPFTRPAVATDFPLAPNTESDCIEYYNYEDPVVDIYENNAVQANLSSRRLLDDCGTVARFFSVNTAQLGQWNPSLNASLNSNDSTTCTLQPGLRYCVLRSLSDESNGQSCDPTNSTMPGTSPACSCFTTIDSTTADMYKCTDIAKQYNITTDQIQQWNSWVGSDCSSGLYAGLNGTDTRSVCVGIDPNKNVSSSIVPSSTATSSVVSLTVSSSIQTSSSIPASTSAVKTSSVAPVASGAASNCLLYYAVEVGDNCVTIEAKTGLNLLELVFLNPFIGLSCTGLVPGFSICIKV